MKKVLIGVGIGCGLLLLVAVGVIAAGGMWAKGKLEGVAASGEQMQKHEETAKSLNSKYAFAKPPQGQPVKLTESRLKDYLAIRAGMAPVVQKYNEEGKKLEDKTKGQQAGFGDVMKAGGLMMDMINEIQASWLEQLDQKKMSPAEFHAITAAILTADMGKAAGEMQKGQREMLTQMKEAFEQQANDENLPEEARTEAKKQVEETDKQIAALPKDDSPSEAQQVHAANAELFAKYKDQWEKDANIGIDAFLWGHEGSDSLGDAMQNAFGGDTNEEAPAEE